MACLSDDSRLSAVSEHNFMAPELLDGTPATFASDLYALGKMIRGASGQDYERDSSVARLVSQLTHASPADRPSASQAVSLLRQVAAEQPFHALHERAKKERDDVLMLALERWRWLYNILEPHCDAAAFRLAGLQQWSTPVAMQAASCLNGVFAAWVGARGSAEAEALADLPWRDSGPSLAAVRRLVEGNRGLSRWNRPEVSTVGQLRIAGAHPAKRDDHLDRARGADRNRQPLLVYADAIKNTASLLDDVAGTEGLILRFIMMLVSGTAAS